MNNCEWLLNMTYEQRGEWLEAEHVEPNDAIGTESDVRPEMVDANDSREKINALRAYYGAGPTAMTDEQIEAGREVYGAKKDADMVIVDELRIDEPDTIRNEQIDNGQLAPEPDSREKLEAEVYNHIAISITPNKENDGVLAPYATVLEWLDRQAAITKAKCEESLASKNLGRLYEPRDNDTREALENDAVLYCDHFTCTHQRFNEAKLIALLDRQAAITERECRQREYAEGDVYRRVYTKSRIDEMIRDAKRELELQRDRNAELKRKLEILKAHGVEIVAAVSGGYEVYNEAIRERDELRAKVNEQQETLDNDCRDLIEYDKALDAAKKERDNLKAQLDEILEGDKATDAINVELQNEKIVLQARVKSLRSKLSSLQAALDQQRTATANANDLWGRTRDELAAVKAERDNLADDLLASNREREHLRKALGIALDHAHDVLALVNLDGEVVS